MSDQQMSGTYYVDIVLCIDATGSMSPILGEVKANAMRICEMFKEGMDDEGKTVEQLRIKVISFRDYGCDDEPMVESDFFVLPEQNDALAAFVNGIEPKGGGDGPENALEAIACALKSDWTTGGKKRRHAILVFTDAPALPLGARASAGSYPAGMPADLATLGAWWAGTSQDLGSTYQASAGRLVVFAPNATPWTDLATWNCYWPTYSQAGKGLDDVQIAEAIAILVGSC